MQNQLILRALFITHMRIIAFHWHDSVNHRYDGKSYSVHLDHVAEVALRYMHLVDEAERENVLAACYMHDAIEDTRKTYNDVLHKTNKTVAEIVYAVTNEKGKSREERANDKYYEGIRNTPNATFVKLCDRIANFEYSVNNQSRMAQKYAAENLNFVSKLYDDKYLEMFNYLSQLAIKNG